VRLINVAMGLTALGIVVVMAWGVTPLMRVNGALEMVAGEVTTIDARREAALRQMMTAFSWCGRGALMIVTLAGVNLWLLRPGVWRWHR